MQVLSYHVDCFDGCANMPSLKVRIDQMPTDLRSRFVFQAVKPPGEKGTLYYAYDDETGLARFMFHDPRNERGYGGAIVTFNMLDSEGDVVEKTVKGPWSSRASVVNRYSPVHMMEVTLVPDTEYPFYDPETGKYWRQRGGIASAMTIPAVQELLKNAHGTSDARLLRIQMAGETHYIPAKMFADEDATVEVL